MTTISWTIFGSSILVQEPGVKFKFRMEIFVLLPEVVTQPLHITTKCISSEASLSSRRNLMTCWCSTSRQWSSARVKRCPTTWTAARISAKEPFSKKLTANLRRQHALKRQMIAPVAGRRWVPALHCAHQWSRVVLVHLKGRIEKVVQPSVTVWARLRLLLWWILSSSRTRTIASTYTTSRWRSESSSELMTTTRLSRTKTNSVWSAVLSLQRAMATSRWSTPRATCMSSAAIDTLCLSTTCTWSSWCEESGSHAELEKRSSPRSAKCDWDTIARKKKKGNKT